MDDDEWIKLIHVYYFKFYPALENINVFKTK